MPLTTWLTIDQRRRGSDEPFEPRRPHQSFKKKGDASAAMREEVARAKERGWAVDAGAVTRGLVVLGKGELEVMVGVVTVDGDGYQVVNKERTGRRVRPEYRGD